MPRTKKEAAVNPVTKATDTKTDEVKTTPVESVADTKKDEAKKTVRKTTAKKTTTKKEPAKKTAAEKEITVKSEEAAPQNEVMATVKLQYEGREISTEELIQNAKNVWEYDLSQKPEDFKTVELYVKPEERAVYYVINGDVTGSFGL